MHEKSLLPIGAQLNHGWFKTPKVTEKIPDFENKQMIIQKIVKLENLSEDLAYGAPKSKEIIIQAITLFKEIEQEINQDVKIIR